MSTAIPAPAEECPAAGYLDRTGRLHWGPTPADKTFGRQWCVSFRSWGRRWEMGISTDVTVDPFSLPPDCPLSQGWRTTGVYGRPGQRTVPEAATRRLREEAVAWFFHRYQREVAS